MIEAMLVFKTEDGIDILVSHKNKKKIQQFKDLPLFTCEKYFPD